MDGVSGLPRGMGRSYGDVCLNPGGVLWDGCGLDRFIEFDDERGLLRCEAGVLLRDIQQLAVPRGWMLPVTPGTWFVTVGGAIANDVHGKNHHRQGSFGDHLQSLLLQRSDGEQLHCSRERNADWFAATVGGLGLTGFVSEACLQLRPVSGPMLEVETRPFDSLPQFYQMAQESEEFWEYTVAWIDCVRPGSLRGIFMQANHSSQPAGSAEPAASGPGLPFTPPLSLVNRLTLRPCNAAYYHWHRWHAGTAVQHYRPFFYPLDRVRDWNRMYGPRGFYQYQCLLPGADTAAPVEEMLAAISDANSGSFLAVLKTFGEREAPGLLSFPAAGATLALDFPNRGRATLDLFARLDAIVETAGGRLYAAKDARMPRQLFESGYPRLEEFLPYRDPGISSGLSRRLLGS
jgi:FAD/FMN-containing dehydrogenase